MDCIDDAATSSSTNDDRLLDLDIYSDFITTENEQSDVAKKYQDLLKVCEDLKESNENLKHQNHILLANISKLYKTAKYELYQKNLKLKGLKQELDAVIFRRNVKHGKFSVSTANVGANFSVNKQRNFNSNVQQQQQQQHNPSNNFNAIRKHLIAQKMNNSNVPSVLTSSTEMLFRYHKIEPKTRARRPKSGENSLKIQHDSTEMTKANNLDENHVKNETGITTINKLSANHDDEIPRYRNRVPDRSPINRFNHHKSEVVRKADAIKRRIRRNSASPRKNRERRNNISPRKRKEMEDGEIASDSEEPGKKRRRGDDDVDEQRKARKLFDVAAVRPDYEHQLEMNRLKMQIRREKVLLSKAREEMNSKDRKYR